MSVKRTPIQLGARPTVADIHTDVADHHSDIFFAAVETTRMPMIVTDPHQPDNPIVFANQAFLRMTGYTPQELVGTNCRFLQGPETERETVSEVRRAIAERKEIATEILNYRKDGSTFHNALFISPVHDEDGTLLFFFASQLDVSERHALAAERDRTRTALDANALLLGESEARHLGFDVERLKRELVFCTALGVGAAVAAAGLIGFIGLVVPHLMRLLVGPDHRLLLPASALAGASLLLLADLVARLALAPAELPIGIVTALLGAPFFLFLLLRERV